MDSDNMGIAKIIAFVVGAVVVIWLLIAIWPFAQVSSGEVGVVTKFNAYSRTMNPGLNWRTPFVEEVTTINIQQNTHEISFDAGTKDLQTIGTAMKVNYDIDQSKVPELFTTVGSKNTDYEAKLIDTSLQSVVRLVVSNYTAEELFTKRQQVTQEIQKGLTDRLTTTGINITNVVTDFKFSAAFEQAIEAKVTAEQNALTEKNKLAQVQYQAEQREAQAKGEAEAIRIQSQAIESQGGRNYVELKKVEVQMKLAEKWQGYLPTTMVPGGALPLLPINLDGTK